MKYNFILEQLPNEIFHELFEYFNTYELYRIFSRLNSRIDSLITNYKYLQITLHSLEDIKNPIHRYFLPKAKTVIINHSKQFYDPLNDILLPVRCLILCRPTREQWDSIKPLFFPSLQRLYLINSVFAYRTEQLCRFIFSNAFSRLHTCSIPHVSYEENNQWTCSPYLQSLRIDIWDIRVYNQILDTCPNLIRLVIELSGANNQEKFLVLKLNKKHLALRYLALYCSDPITCEFIDSILSFVPNLQYFLLNANHQRTNYIPVDTLASIFEDRTPKLDRINISITLPEDLCCQKKINTKHLLFKSYKIQQELIRPSRLIIAGSL